MDMERWDQRYLYLASDVAIWSKDPSTKTGAVLVSPNNRVIAIGFNGFPTGIADDARLLDKDTKNSMIVHCEMNAILAAARPLVGCTLYTWPFLSCPTCASVVIQSGVSRVVARICTNLAWDERVRVAKELFREAGVDVSELPLEAGVTISGLP